MPKGRFGSTASVRVLENWPLADRCGNAPSQPGGGSELSSLWLSVKFKSPINFQKSSATLIAA